MSKNFGYVSYSMVLLYGFYLLSYTIINALSVYKNKPLIELGSPLKFWHITIIIIIVVMLDFIYLYFDNRTKKDNY